MIDTNKYEGHTPAPWYHTMNDYVEALDLDVPLSVCTLAEGEHKDANARLIADAPLLVQEVRRLLMKIAEVKLWMSLAPSVTQQTIDRLFPEDVIE
tara:strand:+ start:556 stop:843 length:288 start_codon:yes stop_codon:yes gene_type:complete